VRCLSKQINKINTNGVRVLRCPHREETEKYTVTITWKELPIREDQPKLR